MNWQYILSHNHMFMSNFCFFLKCFQKSSDADELNSVCIDKNICWLPVNIWFLINDFPLDLDSRPLDLKREKILIYNGSNLLIVDYHRASGIW